jgi:putative Ca2+/H+ antiporter (TMEM165/GDT1 family)
MTQVAERRGGSRERRWRDDWPVAVAAAGAAAAVWVAATQVGSVELAVRAGSGTQHVGVVSVVVTAVVVAMAGAGLLRFLERRTPDGLTVWTAIAVATWVVSFVGPLGARTVASGLVLAAMHAVVGAIVVVGLRRTRALDVR